MKIIRIVLATLAFSFSFGLVGCKDAAEDAAPAAEEAAETAEAPDAPAEEAPKPE